MKFMGDIAFLNLEDPTASYRNCMLHVQRSNLEVSGHKLKAWMENGERIHKL